mmetsp:Transcript_48520/g.103248  ORF Transcript_48520/g.103248 Transcript_48520/m.103248 type:complete len:253 (+) Transcript_48520:124-882(+)
MVTLRKVVSSKDTIPEEDVDVEAPEGKCSPSKTDAAVSAFDSLSAPSGAGHNPVFLAKVILRKVVALIMAPDEEDGDSSEEFSIISLLRDIVLGVVMGVVTIAIFMVLDHRDIIHFESAHNFRDSSFQMLKNNPEIIATLEEAADIKLMTMADYEAKRKEIDGVAEKKAKIQETIDKRTKEAEEKRAQVPALRTEHAGLMNNELLGLNKWCGGCIWSGKTTCDARVAFMQQKYSTRLITAKVGAMSHPCKHP